MTTKLTTVVLLALVAYVLSAIARRRTGQHGSHAHLHGTPYQWPEVARNGSSGEPVIDDGGKGRYASTA